MLYSSQQMHKGPRNESEEAFAYRSSDTMDMEPVWKAAWLPIWLQGRLRSIVPRSSNPEKSGRCWSIRNGCYLQPRPYETEGTHFRHATWLLPMPVHVSLRKATREALTARSSMEPEYNTHEGMSSIFRLRRTTNSCLKLHSGASLEHCCSRSGQLGILRRPNWSRFFGPKVGRRR
jgi:hypothetical protein